MTPNSYLRSNATHIVGGLAPPPGVTPNFVNPDSLHTEWVLTLSTCIIFPTIFIMLRTYTKLILIKSHGWEDCKHTTQRLEFSDGIADPLIDTSFIAWVCLPLICSIFSGGQSTLLETDNSLSARIDRVPCH